MIKSGRIGSLDGRSAWRGARTDPIAARLCFLLVVVLAAEPGSLAAQVQPPGELVDIGGYRIHLWCTGPRSAGPTVVLSSGAGGYALDWGLVQPAIADSSRVCSYDRANFGFSDPGPDPRTLRQEVFELGLALERSGEGGPFVLVGHSMGGLIVRLFAQVHPVQIVGMVLVEATHEDARLGYEGELVRLRTRAADRRVPPPRLFAESPPVPMTGDAAEQCRTAAASPRLFGPYLRLPAFEQQLLLWILGNPKCHVAVEDYLPEEFAQIFVERRTTPRPLGDIPLIVLMGRSSPPPGIDAAEWQREKLAEKEDLATLSSAGRLISDLNSGHFLHFDNPQLVIDAIREVVRRSSTN
jgi:pimeloyl-ACP methyl ester carboxylesterase